MRVQRYRIELNTRFGWRVIARIIHYFLHRPPGYLPPQSKENIMPIKELCNDNRYDENISLGLEYLLKMQFIKPMDKNIKGAILERVVPPNGTDSSPYYIRDLGTIFFIQALCTIIKT